MTTAVSACHFSGSFHSTPLSLRHFAFFTAPTCARFLSPGGGCWCWKARLGWKSTMTTRFLRKAASVVERHRTGFLVVSCAGLLGANLAFHIVPQKTFQPLYQAWAKGQPEISERLHSLFHEVLRDLQTKSENHYEAFAAFSFHPVSAGVPWLPAGCVVGIPVSFAGAADHDEHEIVNHVVVVEGKEVDWRSAEGLALKDALILSLEAQKFAIAREVMYLQNNSPLIHAAVAPVFLTGAYISAVAIKQLLGLYSGPVVLRGLYNLAVAMIGFVGYCLSYDTVSRAVDYRTDRNTATISADYAKGGVEFYNKTLAQNKALRVLMGKRGEKTYAPNGNLFPRYWFRSKHPPYTSRRDLIINILSMSQA